MPRAAPVTKAVLASEARHGEASALQVADQLFFLGRAELGERRAAGLPLRIVAEVRDAGLEGRDHRLFLHDLARGGDAGLQLVGPRRAPVFLDVGDRAGVGVARGGGCAPSAAAPWCGAG